MSFRGRVIRRRQVACYLKPESIQEQKKEFDYLSKIFAGAQYMARGFYSLDQWTVDMADEDRLFYPRDLLPNWTGMPGAIAIEVPVGRKFMLNLFVANAAGTVLPPNQRSGFFYKLADKTWVDQTHPWSGAGSSLPENSEASLTVCSPVTVFYPHSNPPADRPQAPWAVFNMGANHGHEVGAWEVGGKEVVKCYYTSPYFTIPFNMGSQEISEAMMVEEKV